MREFITGATRDIDHGKLDYEGFESPLVKLAFATYMHRHREQADGSLRASDNWKKGIPREVYVKSAARHFQDMLLVFRGHEGFSRAGLDIEMVRAFRGMNDPEHVPLSPEDTLLVEALCALKFNIDGLIHEVMLGRDAGNE